MRVMPSIYYGANSTNKNFKIWKGFLKGKERRYGKNKIGRMVLKMSKEFNCVVRFVKKILFGSLRALIFLQF
jgi:hypothetical protein